MLRMKPYMKVSEAAALIGRSEDFIRGRIEDGSIPGLISKNKVKPTYTVYRMALYDQMGLNTDERLKMSYDVVGLDINDYLVKEKATGANSD